MEKRPLTPAYSTTFRLEAGGALLFCSAVVVQLLQIPPPQLTTLLRLALWGATIAIPPLVGLIVIYAQREEVKIRHKTVHQIWMWYVGGLGTSTCAQCAFWHFLGWGGYVVSFVVTFITVWSVTSDRMYHAKINAPKLDDTAALSPSSPHYY